MRLVGVLLCVSSVMSVTVDNATVSTTDARVQAKLDVLRDPSQSEQTRADAAGELGNFGAAARPAIPDLLAALRTSQPEPVRRNAVIALGRLRETSPDVVAALVAALGDPSSVVREKVALSLGSLGAPAAPAVIEQFTNGKGATRAAAAHALAEIGPPAHDATDPLLA